MKGKALFTDRVAISTGAIQGLGRAHELLLASRGVKIGTKANQHLESRISAPLPHYSSFITSVQPLGSSSQQEEDSGPDATTNGHFNSDIGLEDVTQN